MLHPRRDGIDLAALLVIPLNRHFQYAHLALGRQEQQLNVKSPAVSPLQREKFVCGVGAKALEPALRIREIKPRQRPRDRAESLTAQRAQFGFVVAIGARRMPRSNHHVVALIHSRQKVGDMLYGHSQIRVAHKPPLALSRQHPIAHSRALARVRYALQPETRAICRPFAHYRRRVVRAAVVHHHHLPRVRLPAQIRRRRLQRGDNPRRLIVRGNDYRKMHGVRRGVWRCLRGVRRALRRGV